MAGPDTHVGVQKAMQVDSGTTVTIYRFVVQTGVQTVKQADAASTRVYGVAYTPVTAAESQAGNSGGKTTLVINEGQPLVEAATSFAVRDLVTTDSVGRATKAGTGDAVVGIARGTAAAAGDLLPVELTPGAAKA